MKMVSQYIKDTFWRITASKLKVFLLCEEAFKIQYVDEVSIEAKEESRSFVLGTAFHDLMEYGKEFFLDKYSIADSFLKADLIEQIAERDWTPEKELKKLLLPELRKLYYWADDWAKRQAKIRLTPAEGRDLIWMYTAVVDKPMRDLGWYTDKEQRLEAQFKWLKLSARPDRLLFYTWHSDDVRDITDDMRLSLEEIMELLHWKSKSEQTAIINEMNLKCIIRDFKTTSDLWWMKKDLANNRWDKFWYIISMSFYYTIVYALFNIEAMVRLDVIEKSKPYATDIIALPQRLLQDKLKTTIIPWLDRLNKAMESWEFAPTDRQDVLSNPMLKPYYKYLAIEQKEPSYVDLDL